MQRHFAILFLCLYFLALLSPVAPLVNYAVNKEEITEKYCENKAKPELQCEGKCHLMKQLEKQAEDDQDEEVLSQETILIVGKINQLQIEGDLPSITHLAVPKLNSYFKNARCIEIDYPPQWV